MAMVTSVVSMETGSLAKKLPRALSWMERIRAKVAAQAPTTAVRNSFYFAISQVLLLIV